jgi:hypothetical protein
MPLLDVERKFRFVKRNAPMPNRTEGTGRLRGRAVHLTATEFGESSAANVSSMKRADQTRTNGINCLRIH